MRKTLSTITNEHGFYLPYVLFIVAIVFMILTTTVSMYKKEIKLTETHLEQLKVETLFQMGRKKIKQTLKESKSHGGINYYSFHSGDVKITYNRIVKDKYSLLITVYTENDTTYDLLHYLHLESDID